MSTTNQDGVPQGAIYTAAIRSAIGRVPIWLLTTLMLLLLALPSGQLTEQVYDSAVGNSYEAGSLLSKLHKDFRADHSAELGALAAQLGKLSTLLAALSILLGIFTAGGWLRVFLERTEGRSVRRFLSGGAHHFWRFLRLAVIVLLLLSAAYWIAFEQPWERLLEFWLQLPSADLEALDSELDAQRLALFQAGIHQFMVAMIMTWAIFTRARMSMFDSKSSIWAGFASLFTMLRHPIRTLRPMLAILILEGLIIFAAGSIHSWLESGLTAEAGWQSLALIFACSAVLLALLEILHAARYSAAVFVTRSIVPPLSRPDPWKHSIGAPGGPQYPIVEGDEYDVSL